MRPRLLAAVIVVSGLFAFYLPSSVAGVISRPLSIVSIAGTCALLASMLAASDRRTPPLNTAVALAVVGLPALFTITSPFEQTSAGVVMLYLAQTLLFMLDLRRLRSPAVVRAFTAITAVSLSLGYALAANASAADRVVATWYGAFYDALISNMVVIDNKPVLTFATHSMAGFMIYLFFYMHWHAWQQGARRWRLVAAIGFLGLLVLLRSTTGQAFAAVAGLQLLALLRGVSPRLRTLVGAGLVLAGVAAVAASGVDLGEVYSKVREAIVGDRIRGLFSRYASDGLLASNMKYLSESPLSPIGFGATDTLYLGDSGLVVNALRGSVPLLLMVYGGLWLFLRTNLTSRRAAVWLWGCTVLFEIGFTPLQYFRFVGFVPLMVVFLNSATAPDQVRFEPVPRRDNITSTAV